MAAHRSTNNASVNKFANAEGKGGGEFYTLDEAVRRVLRSETNFLFENNRRFHRMLVDGIDVEFKRDGQTVHDKVWLIDFGLASCG